MSWRKERGEERQEEESVRINGGWSREVRVTSVLTFLTMCCSYCTLQHTIPPLWNVTPLCEIEERGMRNWREGEKEVEGEMGRLLITAAKESLVFQRWGCPSNSPSLPHIPRTESWCSLYCSSIISHLHCASPGLPLISERFPQFTIITSCMKSTTSPSHCASETGRRWRSKRLLC